MLVFASISLCPRSIRRDSPVLPSHCWISQWPYLYVIHVTFFFMCLVFHELYTPPFHTQNSLHSRPKQASLRIDFLIIGAGLAGLACAVALRRVGHRVIVLDRNISINDQVCYFCPRQLPDSEGWSTFPEDLRGDSNGAQPYKNNVSLGFAEGTASDCGQLASYWYAVMCVLGVISFRRSR